MVGRTWSCPACGAVVRQVVEEQERIPVNSMLLLEDGDEARNFPTASMCLAFCHACGFLFNAAFDARLAEYSGRYEASQAYSAKFNTFARGLAQRWIDQHDIRHKTVLEIGRPPPAAWSSSSTSTTSATRTWPPTS
jgi:hypothetical protein